jgi:hypothetical protein
MPAGSTYSTVATTTLSTSPGSYTFSSIPSTYTDLEIVVVGYQTISSDLYLRINGDTGTQYSYTIIKGNGSTATSSRGTSQSYIALGNLGDTANGVAKISVMNYSNTTTRKTVLARVGNAALETVATVGLYRSGTGAITDITIGSGSGGLQSGMMLTLYGITAA